MSRRPLTRSVGALAALAVAALLIAAMPPGGGGVAAAAEQDVAPGDAHVEVQAGHPIGASIHYIVRVTQADGSPAEDATVTATAVADDGRELDPVTLTPYGATAPDGVEDEETAAEQGQFEGIVQFQAAGSWTVRFDASEPAATAETTVEVQEAGAADLDAPDDGGGFSPADPAAADEQASSGSGTPVAAIVVAAIVALVGLAAAIRIIRRYGPSSLPGNEQADDEDAPTTSTPP